MNSLQATMFEKKHNVTGIDSEDPGVHYFLDGSRMGVVIAGEEGYVGLTLEQAQRIAEELPEIIELAKEM